MKKTNKLWLALLLTVLVATLLAVGLTVSAEEPEIIAFGFCGEDGNEESVNWSMDASGALMIAGTGPIKEYGYVRIYNNPFNFCTAAPWDRVKLTSVTIGEGVTNVPNYLFMNCTNLQSVSLAQSVETIGREAFEGAVLLRSITMPERMISIGPEAFLNCTSLPEIILPSGLTVIEYETFKDCAALTQIIIPDGVTTLEDQAFYGCTSLESIDFPDTLTEMNGVSGSIFSEEAPWFTARRGTIVYCGHVIYCAKDLSEEYAHLEISEKTTQIYKAAFAFNDVIQSLSIPANVKVEWFAFGDCKNLKEATFAEGFTDVGSNMFDGCTSLTNVTLPQSLKTIGFRAFYNCTSLLAIVIPPNVEQIGLHAFTGCTSLIHIALPENLNEETYNHYFHGRFPGCPNLLTVFIPESIQDLGAEAFDQFDHAVAVYYGGTQEQWDAYSSEVEAEGLQPMIFEMYPNYSCDWNGDEHEPLETLETVLTPARCQTEGTMLLRTYCVFCGKQLAQSTRPIQAKGHTPGETVIENEVAATCTTAGGYDEVVYCTVCPCELSRNHVTVDPLDHPNRQEKPKVLPRKGHHEHGHEAGVWCPDCNRFISGGETIHNQDGEHRNEVPATVDAPGSVWIQCDEPDCMEWGEYELPQLAPEDVPDEPENPGQPDDPGSGDDGGKASVWDQVISFAKQMVSGPINVLLKLIRWLGKIFG